MCWYIMRNVAGWSLPRIGRETFKFHQHDHSTVHFGLKKLEKQMANDDRIRARVEELTNYFRGEAP